MDNRFLICCQLFPFLASAGLGLGLGLGESGLSGSGLYFYCRRGEGQGQTSVSVSSWSKGGPVSQTTPIDEARPGVAREV